MAKQNRKKKSTLEREQQEEWGKVVEEDRPWRKPVIAGFAILATLVYVLTTYAGVAGGDSGEFAAAACDLGVAHPPGYPLYTWIGKLFTYFPMGSLAWRVNLSSALLQAAAGVFVLLSALELSASVWAGVISAAVFCFSPLIWKTAVRAEVFALNNLFLAAISYLFLRYLSKRDTRQAYLLAFLVGLGLSNHHTLIFFAFPLALLILKLEWPKIRTNPVIFIKLLGVLLLGFVPYLHLPWASARHPLIEWGDQTTWDGFLQHFLRRDYGTFSLHTQNTGHAAASKLGLLGTYLKVLFVETLGLAPLLSIIALKLLWKKSGTGMAERRSYLLWACSGFALYMVVFHLLADLALSEEVRIPVFERMWNAPHLLLCLLVGPGAFFAFQKIRERKSLPYRAFIGFAMGVLLLQIGLHYRDNDQHRNLTLERYGQALLEPLPKDSILMAEEDHIPGVLYYLQACEKMRPDVKVVIQGLMEAEWYADQVKRHHPEIVFPGRAHGRRVAGYTLRQFIEANVDRFPVMFAPFLKDDGSFSGSAVLEFWPYGPVSRALRPGTSVDPAQWMQQSEAALKIIQPSDFKETLGNAWEKHAWGELSLGFYRQGTTYFQLLQREKKPEYVEGMKRAWNQYLAMGPKDESYIAFVKKGLAAFP